MSRIRENSSMQPFSAEIEERSRMSSVRTVWSFKLACTLLLVIGTLAGCTSTPNPGGSGDPSGKKPGETTTLFDAVKCESNKDCESTKYCYNKTICLSETEICNRLDCDHNPGVCDADQGKCVPAEDGNCQTNGDCAKGDYCDNTSFSCRVNTCKIDENGKRCPGGGECVRGNCQNKEKCKEKSDCLPTSTCVKQNAADASGVCVAKGDECGSCPGNQLCGYDAARLVASCQPNPAGCDTSEDCRGLGTAGAALFCQKRRCVEESAVELRCEADVLEGTSGNNTKGDASDYHQAASAGQLAELSLCNNDQDWFTFDPAQFALSGKLVVTASFKSEEVGRKTVKMELYDTCHTDPIKTVTSDASKKTLKLTMDYQSTSCPGNYTLKFAEEGTPPSSDLSFSYSLSIDVVEGNVVSACKNPTTLTADVPVTGQKINDLPLTKMNLSCAVHGSPAPHGLYKLEIPVRSYVEVDVKGGKDTDVAFAIRKSCESASGEIQCTDARGDEQPERISTVLDRGTYFVVVTTRNGVDYGKYDIVAKVTPTTCTSDIDACSSDGRSMVVCNATQTDTETRPCGILGCDTARNSCFGEKGDTCEYAYEVPATATLKKPYKIETRLTNLSNQYTTSCSGAPKKLTKSKTTGNDIVFKAEVPPGKAIFAKLVSAGVTSLYIVEDCSELAVSQCLQSSEKQLSGNVPVRIVWKNTSKKTVTRYLVMDYDHNRMHPATVELEVAIDVPLCAPFERSCQKSQLVLTCNEVGSAWDGESINCGSIGCNASGQCNTSPLDSCGAPDDTVLTPGKVLTSESNEALSNDLALPSSCKRSVLNADYRANSNDAAYKLVAEAGNVYTVKVTPTDGRFIPAVWITEADSCDPSTNTFKSDPVCITGATSSTSSAVETKLYAKQAGTYYVIVDSNGDKANPESKGQYSIEVTKTKAAEPYRILDCDQAAGKVVYNDSTGLPLEYMCACTPSTTSSKTAVCGSKKGETCLDAKVLYDAANVSPSKTGREDKVTYGSSFMDDMVTSDYKIDRCYLYGRSPNGADRFYKFILDKGDLVEVNLEGVSSNHATIFFQEDESCGNPFNCFGARHPAGSARIYHRATKDKEAIIAVVKTFDKNHKANDPETFSLKWSVIPKADQVKNKCIPNGVMCDADGTHVEYCNEDGTEIIHSYACACEGGVCQDADPASGTECSHPIVTAVDAQSRSGGTYIVNLKNGKFKNEMNPTCTDRKAGGEDAFFRVTGVKAGQVIDVKFEALGGTSSLGYILKDSCSATQGTCIASFEDSNRNYSSLTQSYVSSVSPAMRAIAKEDGDYIIGVGFKNGQQVNGLMYVDIKVVDQDSDCKSNSAFTSCTNDVLTYCENGLKQKYSCTCHGAKCQVPSGELCSDAIVLDNTKGKKHTLMGQDRTASEVHRNVLVDDNISGNCLLLRNMEGTAKYYSIELAKDDLLHIEHNSVYYSAMILSECGKTTECLAATPISSVKKKPIDFKAPKDGTYYLVMAGYKNALYGSKAFDLSYTVTAKSGSCVPHTSICKDDHTVEVCNSKSEKVEYSCNCYNGKCTVPMTADSCIDAPTITNGYTAVMYAREFGNTVELDFKSDCLKYASSTYATASTGSGRDAIFKVDLEYGAKVNVYTDSAGWAEDRVGVYFFQDCADVTGTCITGRYEDEVGFHGPYSYRNARPDGQRETIMIAVDDAFYSIRQSQSRFIWFEVEEPNCSPSDQPMCDNSTNKLMVCDPISFLKVGEVCDGACNAGEHSCATPTGDSCYDPIPLREKSTVAGVTTYETEVKPGGALTNAHTPVAGKHDFIKPSQQGNDSVFSVVVPSGKTVEASLVSTASPKEDLAVYMSPYCAAKGDAISPFIVAGSDSDDKNNPEVASYENASPTDQTVYIIVDSFDAAQAPSGDFELKVTVK